MKAYCFAESLVEPKDREFLRAFISKKSFVPFARLPEDYGAIRGAEEANLLYREFYLIARFIIERYGSTALRRVLQSLGSGSGIGDAFREHLSVELEEFGKIWEPYVYRKTGL